MTFYTLVPNYYPNLITIPSYSFPLPNQKPTSILSILSQALQKSIDTFEATHKDKFILLAEETAKECIDAKKAAILAMAQFDEQEKRKINEKLKKGQNKQIEEKIVPLKTVEEKSNQNSSQHITSDHHALENLEKELFKKNDSKKEKNKKQKKGQTKDNFVVRVPTVNLIETAPLGFMEIGCQQIQKRREKLLMRKVKDWNEKGNGRREKRQIRMLNN